MYWCSNYQRFIKAGILLLGLACVTAACRPDVKETKGQFAYFDIKGFFTADAARLNRLHPAITKTVAHNGISQTRKIVITDWLREFDLFINSDINKPAWSQSYTVQKSEDMLIYKAMLPDLKTRSVVVKLSGSKVQWIMINNYTKNILYENAEKLTYFPDSLCRIQKLQHVRLLGKNEYDIKEVF